MIGLKQGAGHAFASFAAAPSRFVVVRRRLPLWLLCARKLTEALLRKLSARDPRAYLPGWASSRPASLLLHPPPVQRPAGQIALAS